MRFVWAIAVAFLILGLIVGAIGLLQPAKAVLGQWLLETAFAAGGTEPWPGADMRAVSRLRIERLGVALIVIDRANGKGMAWGPGIVAGTDLPGKSGLSVIAGHRDSHMAFLGNVRIGDEVKFTTVDGEETEYRVSGAMVVDSSHWSPQSDPEGTLYMVTCWPLDGQETTSKRLVVVARHNLGGADDTALYLRGRASETMVKSVVFLHPRLLILRNSCQTFPMRNLKL